MKMFRFHYNAAKNQFYLLMVNSSSQYTPASSRKRHEKSPKKRTSTYARCGPQGDSVYICCNAAVSVLSLAASISAVLNNGL